MEISAFGVVHKSFKKLKVKLGPVNSVPRKTDSLQDRQKVNYSQWRFKSGALQNNVNPNNFKAADAKNLEYGIKTPDARTAQVRQQGRDRAREQAKNLKKGSQAMITGHANAGKKKRYLP